MKKNIFSVIVFGMFSIFNIYFFGILEWLSFITFVALYFFIFYSLHIFYRLLTKGKIQSIKLIIPKFTFRFLLLLLIPFVLTGFFIFYENEISPAEMPVYTISNGKKIVVFQTMSHIGSENFYKKVEENISKYKKENYVYFYEGVKLVNDSKCVDPVTRKLRDTKECVETKKQVEKDLLKFNQILGFNFSNDFYEKISELIGLKFQDQETLLDVVNDKDINIDLSLNKILSLYESKYGTGVYSQDKQIVNFDEQVFDEAKKLNSRGLWLVRYLYKGLLNFMIKDEDLGKNLGEQSTGDILSVILEDRDKNLAGNILNSEFDKIYVTYGLLHFKGTFDYLKSQDINWMITDVKFIKSIE
ncbi:MAG: hypothetical protein PHF46_00835 [Candidatus Gracilibacteria bacterium]|nr:hypothetical protein [Candidatus Gracilibacteria bacterium]MDD4530157.1 hypothetical protein [Candidatus Gracilibacteria bacterium]